jgi:hypothetical protein
VHDGSVDDFAGNWLAYAAASDRKDDDAAALHLERCLELMHLLGPSIGEPGGCGVHGVVPEKR